MDPGAGVFDVLRGALGLVVEVGAGTVALELTRGAETVADRTRGRAGAVVGREGFARAGRVVLVVVVVRLATFVVVGAGADARKGCSSSPEFAIR